MSRWLPLVPFPPLSWWHFALREEGVGVDLAEGYRKQSIRNRLMLADAKGSMMVSFPIDHVHRRAHPLLPMRDMQFSQHIPIRQILRSIETAYGRAPFFEHVMPELLLLVEKHGPGAHGATLGHFSRATLRMMTDWSESMQTADLNALLTPRATTPASGEQRISEADLAVSGWQWRQYGQPFEDRLGFHAGLSSLDTLFCVGPAWLDFLPSPLQP